MNESQTARGGRRSLFADSRLSRKEAGGAVAGRPVLASPWPVRCLSGVLGIMLAAGVCLQAQGTVSRTHPRLWPAGTTAERAAILARRSGVGLLEIPPVKPLPVWVDTRSGLYYFSTERCYGATPEGRYLRPESARAQGYRSAAKR